MPPTSLPEENEDRRGLKKSCFSRWRHLAFWVLIPLWLAANVVWLALPRGGYGAIVVHHSAGSHGDFRSIRRAHLRRGWFEIAYHLVLSNGSTGVPRGHLEPTWRYRLGLWSVATRNPRHNLRSVHLCVVGDYEASSMPPALARSLGLALAALQEKHGLGDEDLFLHRQCSATACPGQHLTLERLKAWTKAGRAELRQDPAYLETLQRSVLVPWLYGLLWIAINAAPMAWWARRWLRRAPRRGRVLDLA